MTGISPRTLEETITTSGYQYTKAGNTMYYITRNGTNIASGTLTLTGRLDIAFPTLHKITRTIHDLGETLDQLNQQTQTP